MWSPDRLLSWADFKAEPNPAAFEDAHSAITYRPTWVVKSEQDACGAVFFLIADLQIKTEFLPMLSWARPVRDDVMLLHEQGHFDLGKIVADENLDSVRSRLYGQRFPTRGKNEEQCKQFAKEDSAVMVDHEIRHILNVLADRRAKYDLDTKYGADLCEQSRYDGLFGMLRKSRP